MQSRRNSKSAMVNLRARRMVATMCIATLVLSAVVAPAATAAPAADSGTTAGAPQMVSAAQVLSEVDDPEDTQAVLDYWTEERMREARPIALPEAPATGAVTPPFEAGDGLSASEIDPADHVHHTDYLPTDQLGSHPHASVGKVFLTLNGLDHVCSASAVTTEGRWGPGSGGLVATAGHCVSDGNGQFVSRWMFVPGYDEGAEPFGRWAPTNIFTTNAWHLGRDFARDVAFARVVGTGEHAGARLSDVVEPLDIAFTETYPEDGLDVRVEPAVGDAYASLGYGVESWGGERLVRSMSPVVALDPNSSPNTQGIYSSHTGGSSGGPWLHNYAPGADGEGLNVLNSVNSYVYRGIPVMYGPRFDDQIHTLWAHSNQPAITVSDVVVAEGHSGTTAATFTVPLDAAGDEQISVDYATVDGTAEAGSDYTTSSGTLTFAPGQTAQHVIVDVIGDTVREDDEIFAVLLFPPSNAILRDGRGDGTILDDEPNLSILGATVTEGDAGTTTATFPVSLDAAGDLPVTVEWFTQDYTAEAGSDYTAGSGTLTFAPGQTAQQVTVDVIGDTLDEADETFTVDLSYPSNPSVVETAGVGTIIDDDEPEPAGGGGGAPFRDQSEPDGSVSEHADAGGTVSGEGEGGRASVTTPSAGTVTIAVRLPDEAAPSGFEYLPVAMDITAPGASAEDPLVLVFTLDADALPEGAEVGDIVVFRDGVPLVDCAGATSGGPCVSERGVDSETGDVRLHVITPAASTWTFGLPQVQPAPEPVEPVRLSGDSNVTAAIAWSRNGFDQGGAAAVLLGRDDVFADSLASGSVQGHMGAPLLLTPSDSLDARTADEIQRLGARTVVILGGTAAVSEHVEAELVGLGYAVERVSGGERLSTATAVAGRFFAEATTAIVARADGGEADPTRAFADSLGAGALGAATGQPVLLSASDELSEATAEYLASSSITSVTIAGGAPAVSDQVVTDLTALGIGVARASGANRFGTAAALADRGGYQQPTAGVLLVDGSGADAWASGFAAASRATAAPLLLIDGPRVPAETLLALGGMGGSQPTCGPHVIARPCDQALAAIAAAAGQ